MRIGIDTRCFALGRTTGVEEYTKYMLTALFERMPEAEFKLFFNAYKGVRYDFSWATAYPNVRVVSMRIPNKLLNLTFWYLRRPYIDRLLGGVDVLWLPNSTFAAWSKDTACVVTSHDLSFEHYPETFSWKRRAWHFFVNPRRLYAAADHVVAVSDATRRDIVHTYGIAEDKVTTVVNGSDFVPCLSYACAHQADRTGEDYILYFGTLEPRKNIATLVEAYTLFRENSVDEKKQHRLVLAGARGWRAQSIMQAIATSPYKEDIIIFHDVDQRTKECLYAGAHTFVYPSVFEGFGFPPCEAMLSGVPTIVSRTSSLPEAVGAASVMVHPERVSEIALALHDVTYDDRLRGRLKKQMQGTEKRVDSSWQKKAQKMQDIFEYQMEIIS